MLVIGLLVTIGSSFSTIPILTTIFVPLCIQLGFSPMATIAIIGTAGALGDAGSPASDSTLGPTSGLNADGQHHHIWDTCVPTFYITIYRYLYSALLPQYIIKGAFYTHLLLFIFSFNCCNAILPFSSIQLSICINDGPAHSLSIPRSVQ